jgi:predicted phage terminase large subunit-like protein
MKINKKDHELFIEKPHLLGVYLGYPDLIDLHSKWINTAWLDKSKQAMQAHRNSYKTTSILIVGSIWYLLYFDPNATILIIRKSDTDAQKIVRTLRDHFQSNKVIGLFNSIYCVNRLDTDQWSSSSLKLSIKTTKTPEGNIESRGIGGAITGSHYSHIFPDDIVTRDDRYSKAERTQTKDFIRELKNIKKQGGRVFYSGTPWHKDDAWTILPEPDKYPIGTVPIKGFLPHELPAKIAELKTGNTESLYCANYELKHVSTEELLFDDPQYCEWPDAKFPLVAYLDPAFGQDDYTAITIGGVYDKKIYIAAGYVWKHPIDKTYDLVENLFVQYGLTLLIVESNQAQVVIGREFIKRGIPVKAVWQFKNKLFRIEHYAKKFWSIIYFNKKILENTDCLEYMEQITSFYELADHDDAPDSLAGFIQYYSKL